PTGWTSVPAGPRVKPPARNGSTAGVVSEGLKLFFDNCTLESSGPLSRPKGIAHGTLSGSVEREPIWIAPSAGGPGVGVPWKDAFTRIVTLPPGGRRKRSGEAVSARPAPPVCGSVTRRLRRRLDRLRIVSFWTECQFVRAAGPKAS